MPRTLGTPEPARLLSRARMSAARTCGTAAKASRANAAGIDVTRGVTDDEEEDDAEEELGSRAYAKAAAVIDAVIWATRRKGVRRGGTESVNRKDNVICFWFLVVIRILLPLSTYTYTYTPEDI